MTLDPTKLAATFDTLKNSIDTLYKAILILAGASVVGSVFNMVSGLKMANVASRALSSSLSSSSASVTQIVKGTDKLGRTFYRNAATGQRVSTTVGQQAMQTQNAAKFGKVAKVGGAALGGVLAGGAEYLENKELGMEAGENLGRSAIKGTTAGLGGWGGAAAGAAIGTAIVPVIGTAIGGLIGGILGAMAGGEIGEAANTGIYGDKSKIIKTQDSYSQLDPNGGLVVAKFNRGTLDPKIQGSPDDKLTLHSPTPSSPTPTTTPNKFSEQQMNEMLMYLKQIAAKDTTLRVGATEWSSAQTIGEVRVQ